MERRTDVVLSWDEIEMGEPVHYLQNLDFWIECVCFLVQEARIDKPFQKEPHIHNFRVFDSKWLQHPQIPILHSHEDGSEMVQVTAEQV